MKKTSFKLETLTPILCSGANNKKPEIRPSSFKGLIRYWYRAALAKDDLTDLHREENSLMGSTGESSNFSITIDHLNQFLNGNKKSKWTGLVKPVPHKSFKAEAILPDKSITVHLRVKKEEYLTHVEAAFKLAIRLGGIGKRSRRGFGSFKLTDHPVESKVQLLEEILSLLHLINEGTFIFHKTEMIIENKHRSTFKYPVIKKIQFGGSYDNPDQLLTIIAKGSKEHRDFSLGNHNPRMSSPVYVTAVLIKDQYYPLITRLEGVYPKNYGKRDTTKIDHFINFL